MKLQKSIRPAFDVKNCAINTISQVTFDSIVHRSVLTWWCRYEQRSNPHYYRYWSI